MGVTLYTEATVAIPEGVEVVAKSRVIKVTGKHGVVERQFKHLPLDIEVVDNGRTLKVSMWRATTKQKACVRTFCSHVENMITGVTKKFQYKMRLVYNHFPINVNISEDGKVVEIRQFLGEKRTRAIDLPEGVTCVKSTAVKDELIVSGVNLESVSRACALIHQNALVRNKDIRQFLDGIYVSEKGVVEVEA